MSAKPERRRRKKLTREERRERSEYMRKYRAKKADTTTGAPVAAGNDGAPVVVPEATAAPEAHAAQAKPPEITIEKAEAMLKGALAGTAEALADTAQLLFLDGERPHLGRERAKTLGELWAPILAPYITVESAKWLTIALAAGGTANIGYQWAHEYRAAKPKPALQVVRPPQEVAEA
ncbi:MAG: hypothetical protein M0R37_13715 [Bacteroidales bacterium]|jgi:hypothetical protein|nr:hypothetical protein [Bacteroidales bacterium]